MSADERKSLNSPQRKYGLTHTPLRSPVRFLKQTGHDANGHQADVRTEIKLFPARQRERNQTFTGLTDTILDQFDNEFTFENGLLTLYTESTIFGWWGSIEFNHTDVGTTEHRLVQIFRKGALIGVEVDGTVVTGTEGGEGSVVFTTEDTDTDT